MGAPVDLLIAMGSFEWVRLKRTYRRVRFDEAELGNVREDQPEENEDTDQLKARSRSNHGSRLNEVSVD